MLRDALQIIFAPVIRPALNGLLSGLILLANIFGVSQERLAGGLRCSLRLFPWWSRGHLDLGLSELRVALNATERSGKLRAITAARISADGVLELEGGARELGGKGNSTLIARAKALKGLVLIEAGDPLAGLEILKGALALNNLVRLTPVLRRMALEGGAKAAFECGDDELGRELSKRL